MDTLRATIAIALLMVLTPVSLAYPQGAYYLGPRLPASGEAVIQRYAGPRAEDEQYCTFSHVNGGPAQRFLIRPDGWLREGEVLRTADTWLLPGEHALAISWVGFRGAIILRFRASAGDTLVSRCFMRTSGRELRAVAQLTDQRTQRCVASSLRESPCGNPDAPRITEIATFLPDSSGQLVMFPEDSAVRPLLYHPDRRHPLYVRSQISEGALARFARDPQALQLLKAFANALEVAITDSAGRPLPGQGMRLAGVRDYAHRKRGASDGSSDLTAFVDEGGVLVTVGNKLYAMSDDSTLVDLAPASRQEGPMLRGLAEEIRLAMRSAGATRLDAVNLYFPALGARLVAVLQVTRGREHTVIEVGRRNDDAGPGVPPARAQNAAATADPDSSRLALASRLVTLLQQNDRTMESALRLKESRAQLPQLPAVIWDTLSARMIRAMSGLQDSLIPLYASRYSSEELQGFLDFFSSPLGSRYRAEQPALTAAYTDLVKRVIVRVTDDFEKNVRVRAVPRP